MKHDGDCLLSLCGVGICSERLEMTTEDRSRHTREHRYVIVSKETVRQHAESVGIAELSDQILEALAEDVSYRVRDVIQVRYRLRHVIQVVPTHDLAQVLLQFCLCDVLVISPNSPKPPMLNALMA